nr:MAG TPA: hypothetical protein [Caudoviricetes sp.]
MNFASDPILGGQQSQQDTLSQMNEWAQKFAELQKQKGNFNMQPQQSKTPTWDEIDKIMDSLTDTQKNYLNQNQDFVESYQDVANILQREELRIIRPLVEQTKDGKEALDKHLSLIKKLKKNAMQAEEEKTALWNEYMTNYSDMTFKDFMAMKKQDKKGGSK